jgi:hypothetical protein
VLALDSYEKGTGTVPDLGASIYERFALVVGAHADEPAIAGESGRLSYGELDRAARAWSGVRRRHRPARAGA